MSSGTLRLLRDAMGVISHIDGIASLKQLLDASAIPGTASAKILYSLLFAGIIEVRPQGAPPPPDAERRKSPGRRATDLTTGTYKIDLRNINKPPDEEVPEEPATPQLPPRALVLEMHRQLDWLSHYDLLGVSRKATPAQIDAAFKARSLLFDPTLKAHPELVDCWRQLTVLTKWLRVAYGVLSNPDTRSAYDRKIDDAARAAPPGSAEPPK
jgi:hypothetical protein